MLSCDIFKLKLAIMHVLSNTRDGEKNEGSDYIVYNITKITVSFSVLGVIGIMSFKVLYAKLSHQQIECGKNNGRMVCQHC